MDIKRKNIGLDLLRVILAIQVYLFHLNAHGITISFGHFFITNGPIAMEAFFILSGFCIEMKYGDKDIINDKNCLLDFYKKRFIKIMPISIVIMAIDYYVQGTIFTKKNLVLYPFALLGIESEFGDNFYKGIGDWFVSCIMICYLFYPFLSKCVSYLRGGQKRKQILAICFAYLLVAVAPISAKIAGMQIVYSNTFFRAIQFLIGIMIYRFVIEEKVKWIITNKLISIKFSVEIFSIIIIATTYIMSRIGGNYTCYEFYTVPLYSLLIMSLYIRKYKYIPVFTNMVLFLSKMSYTIYLAYHCSFYIGDYLTSKFSINHNIKILMYIALDIIIAYVFMRLQNLITKTYYILTEKEKRRE